MNQDQTPKEKGPNEIKIDLSRLDFDLKVKMLRAKKGGLSQNEAGKMMSEPGNIFTRLRRGELSMDKILKVCIFFELHFTNYVQVNKSFKTISKQNLEW